MNINNLDLDSLLKESGADRPKQTRPNDAKWQNNVLQYKVCQNCETWSPWMFCHIDEEGDLQATACPTEMDFMVGKRWLDRLRETHDPEYMQFRLVAILEVK